MACNARSAYDWYSYGSHCNNSICTVYGSSLRWVSRNHYWLHSYINTRMCYRNCGFFANYCLWFNHRHGVYI